MRLRSLGVSDRSGSAEASLSPGTAPGPRGWPLLGSLREFRCDVLGLLASSRALYGDVVRFRLGPMVLHLVAHPDAIRRVLQERTDAYDKETRSSSKIRALAGLGLLTSNGPRWKRQRRLIQPGFKPGALDGFVPLMVESTDAMLERWGAQVQRGGSLDLASEMMRLTYTIAGRTLLSSDVSGGSAEAEAAMEVLLAHTYRRLERIVDPPLALPTPRNRRFHAALATLDKIVYGLIGERRHQIALGGAPPADLLTTLVQQRDEDGAGMSDRELRDETITLLLAGHETTANALVWAFHLLSLHPEAAERLRTEVEAVLGDRAPEPDDLERLPFADQVLREALRLYPPIWVLERHARQEDEIDGFRIAKDSTVLVSPWVTHRHPAFWSHPEAFDPDRFAPGQGRERPLLAWLPFGAGPRYCIGGNFAVTEMLIVLARVVRRFHLCPVPGHTVEPLAGITLRAKYGVRVLLEPAKGVG